MKPQTPRPESDPKQTLLDFLTKCKPVARENGAKFEELRDAAALRLHASRAEVGSSLTQVGVSRKHSKAGNVAVWQHPGWKQPGADPALQLP